MKSNDTFFYNPLITLLLFFSFSLLVISCRKDEQVPIEQPGSTVPLEDPLNVGTLTPATISGMVVDENGQPLSGVQVKIHHHLLTTAADGMFLLEGGMVPSKRYVIKATKVGYFPGIRALVPEKNKRTETRLVLMSSGSIHSFASGSGGNINLSKGEQVHIPANGLVTAAGSRYSGQVNMAVRYLDPSAPGFGMVVSGGDMLARRQDQSTSILYSYGILRVMMTGAAGEPLQLAPGSAATLAAEIPESLKATAPATIPLWYFDEEEGFWKEEGQATRQGNTYTGTVKHFTDWNFDAPSGFATIRGRLLDCHNMPAGGYIEFGQISSDPQSSIESRETDGRFQKRVPTGVSLTVTLNDPLILTPLTSEGRGKLIVVVPPLTEGQVYDLGDIRTFPCPTDLTATIKTASGDKVRSVIFTTRKGSKVLELVDGKLKASLPPAVSMTMTIYTQQGIVFNKDITTPAEGLKMDLGVIDLTLINIKKEVYITGKVLCNGTPETPAQVSASWKDNTGNTDSYSTSLDADGSFKIIAPVGTSLKLLSVTPHGKWERMVLTSTTPGDIIALGTMDLCVNPAIKETGFVITGDGFDGKLETLETNKNYDGFSYARYMKGSDPQTVVYVKRLSKDLSFTVFFPEQMPGERGMTKTFFRIERKVGNQTTYYEAGPTIAGSTLQLNITQYGKVGEPVEGTFSGTFIIKGSGGKKVTITNGIFSVLRHEDR
jgi:hypothetical protein